MGLFGNASLCCVALFGAACTNDRNHTLANQVVALGKPNAEYPGIAEARVCVSARPEFACATTDAQGFFTLGLPTDTEIVLTIEKDGYIPSLKPIAIPASDTVVPQPIVMFKMADLPTDLGFDVDVKDSGLIDFFVFEFLNDGATPGALPGVKVTLSPEIEHGAVYFSEPGLFDPTLKATASYSGTFGRGNVSTGRFFNVPPGDYALTFTAPEGYKCASFTGGLQAWGFPVPGKSAVRSTVRQGYDTYGVGMHCER